MVMVLFICLAIPLLTALALMLFRSSLHARSARWVALTGSIATLAMTLQLAAGYANLPKPLIENAPVQPRVEYHHPWLTLGTADAAGHGSLQFEFYFGLDGISIALILLTTILTCVSIVMSWQVIKERTPEFYASILVLEAGLIGVFCAFDVILFYAFFELTLIPLFFLIAIWGGPQRQPAAIKFFLYTLAGSLVTLLGLVTLILHASSSGLATPSSIPALAAWLQVHPLDSHLQTILFLAVATGFLVKVPVFPFHTWLPQTYVEAPTTCTILLAGVLSKLGLYGFLRLCLPMFPEACLSIGLPAIGVLSVIGIVYGSLCALAQRDLKRLVAYSSVAHLGFCTLGLFALNVEGISGCVLQMVNHGLATGALFLLVGMISERYQTRDLDELGGLGAKLPLFACSFVFISMASIGLPGLNGFVGEILCLAGMFEQHPIYTALGATGVILGAWYLLSAVQSLVFGPLKEPAHHEQAVSDMTIREMCAFVPLAVACLWLGVLPGGLVDLVRPDVVSLSALYRPAVQSTAQSDYDHASSNRTSSGLATRVLSSGEGGLQFDPSFAAMQPLDTMKTQRSLLSGNGN